MKTAITFLRFLLKMFLICLYMVTRGSELFLKAFNKLFRALLRKLT